MPTPPTHAEHALTHRIGAVLMTLDDLFTPGEREAMAALADRPPQCVASTGVFGDRTLACESSVDGAHRCSRAPQHQHTTEAVRPSGLDNADHLCDCGFVWAAVTGGSEALAQEWRRVRKSEAGLVLSRVLTDLHNAGIPGASVLSRVVVDVARELKIDLGGAV